METIKCCICNSNTHNVILNSDNNLYNEYFSVVRCECGFKFLNPRPTEKEIANYYNVGDYHPHSQSKGFLFSLYVLAQKITFWWKLKIIRMMTPGKIVHLDYGSGDGSFVKYMMKNGYDSTGFDPLYNSREAPAEFSKYNVITFWHSLEHIHNLTAVFKLLSNHLNCNGIILVAVPNFNSFDRQFFKNEWAAYDLPRHLYHFDPNSLEQLFSGRNYTLIKKKKMYLDTVYNCLITYKSSDNISFLWFLYALVISLLGVAINSPNKSSSLFYVFKKNS